MYKLSVLVNNKQISVIRLSDSAIIPIEPANTDYVNFKKQINNEESQLQDAEGNTMTAEQAKEFIKELP